MNAGNKAPKAKNGQRLIWGYEDAGLNRVAKELTPLEKRKKDIEGKEREEKAEQRRKLDARREERKERKSSKREKRSSRSRSRDRDKDRDKEERRARRKSKSRSRSRERTRDGGRDGSRDVGGGGGGGGGQHHKKFDLKEAGRQHRDAVKENGGMPVNTVEGKSILLNLLQNTLHQNRVLDNEQLVPNNPLA
jgi:hypothetical protein